MCKWNIKKLADEIEHELISKWTPSGIEESGLREI